MNEKFKTTYTVVKAFSLDELAEKLTHLAEEYWSTTVMKTEKIVDVYQCLVKCTDKPEAAKELEDEIELTEAQAKPLENIMDLL